jgi:hypothetical protein
LRRREHDHPSRTAARDQVAQQLREPGPLLAILARQIERQLIARHHMQRHPRVTVDLAQPAGEQFPVAALHLHADLFEQRDRLAHIRANDPLRARRPRRQLDQLAVQQPQPGRRVERGGGDQHRHRRRLPGARLTARQQAALHHRHLDRAAVLVDAERDRLPQRRLRRRQLRPRHFCLPRQRVTPHERHRPTRRVPAITSDAQLSQRQAARQLLRAITQLVERRAPREPHLDLLAGRHPLYLACLDRRQSAVHPGQPPAPPHPRRVQTYQERATDRA